MFSLVGTAKIELANPKMAAVTQLRNQWINPSDISTILMIIGGDVVQTALAQSTGTWFTPVCFSFGWVAYAFMALVSVIGDGRLLPLPDYPVKVFNLKSGYVRDNQNWVIGRILRDHEAWISKKTRCNDGIRISIFEAKKNENCWTKFSYDRLHLFGLLTMVVQFAIVSVPIVLDGDWTVMLVVGVGTLLALGHGSLPQWTAEKLPNRQHADTVFGLTTGNGSRDVMIIRGAGNCLNLEDFAITHSPRNGSPWEKFDKHFAKAPTGPDDRLYRRTGSLLREAKEFRGLPVGFWITLVTTFVQSLLWLLLLNTVAGVKHNTWYLLLAGGIGMFQNGIIAAIERPPKSRNLPLEFQATIARRKVMDGLMDLEDALQCARPLVQEFFPGDLRPDEKEWWDNGNREPYERKRNSEIRWRGIPGGKDIQELVRLDSYISAAAATTTKERNQEKQPPPASTMTTIGSKSQLKSAGVAERPSSPRLPHPPSITFSTDVQDHSKGRYATLPLQAARDLEEGPRRISPSWS